MLDLAVVESRWWEEGNHSVRGIFELIAAVRHQENPHAYHYEMFNNAASLKEIVPRVAKKKNIRNLVIAAHGDEDGIYGAAGDTRDGNRISRAVFRNILEDIPRGSLDGLYLGTCATANDDTVEFLMDGGRVRWVAGYSEETDWLEGTCLDLFFWTTYYGTNRAGGPLKRIERVAERMGPVMGLCEDWGFDIYVRRRGRGGGVRALLAEMYPDDDDTDE